MKPIIALLLITLTTYSCSRDEDRSYSAIEQLTGTWELQSKIINDTNSVDIGEEFLHFKEDNDIRDFKGLYNKDASLNSSGTFILTNNNSSIILKQDNLEEIIYDFRLNRITLTLARKNTDGDIVKEIWIKTRY